MSEHVFTGFGFGPIQSGLFVNEAFQSRNFKRIAISEIDKELVAAVRKNNGTYFVNVARSDSIEVVQIDNVELFDPNVDADREALISVLTESTEMSTSLPSVNFFSLGDNSVTSLISAGLENSSAPGVIIYTGENNNHAAEILAEEVTKQAGKTLADNVQFLNTVIGKMSRVVTDTAEIEEMKLTTIAPGIQRAFLVEQFNKILVTRSTLNNFQPGIEVFAEKDDLFAFEEAKLYGHNAIHALLAYMGMAKGYTKMTELKSDRDLMKIAKDAFLNECGAALIKKYSNLNDELFTEQGYKVYAADLLVRMTNPYLEDTTARAGRDIRRKLADNDRIFGTIHLVLDHGMDPVNMAIGAAAGIYEILKNPEANDLPDELMFDWQNPQPEKINNFLLWLWQNKQSKHQQKITQLISNAFTKLSELIGN